MIPVYLATVIQNNLYMRYGDNCNMPVNLHLPLTTGYFILTAHKEVSIIITKIVHSELQIRWIFEDLEIILLFLNKSIR